MEMSREIESCKTDRTLLAHQIKPPFAPSISPASAAYKVTVLQPQVDGGPVCWVRRCSEPTRIPSECQLKCVRGKLLSFCCCGSTGLQFRKLLQPSCACTWGMRAALTVPISPSPQAWNAHSTCVPSRRGRVTPADTCSHLCWCHAVLFALGMAEQSNKGFKGFPPPVSNVGHAELPHASVAEDAHEFFALSAFLPITTGYCRHHHYPARAVLAHCAVAMHSVLLKVEWLGFGRNITIWKSYITRLCKLLASQPQEWIFFTGCG